MSTKKAKRKLEPEAIAKIKETQFKPKWQHTPTSAVRLPSDLVPFLKYLAVKLDKELFLINERQLPEAAIYSLLNELSSSRLENLCQQLGGSGQVSGIISSKREQEKEEEKRRSYRVEIKDSEPDSSKIAVYSPYDPTGKRQRICKSIEGYSFDGDNKSWHFPKEAIAQVLEAFPEDEYWWKDDRLKMWCEKEKQRSKELEKQRQREEEARQQRKRLDKMIFENNISSLVPDIDRPLANGWELRNYQKEGVNWLIHRQRGGIYHGGILADDMGLGKTIEALTAAKLLRSHFSCHVFVVCPVSLIENWQREAERVGVKIEIFGNHYRKIPQPGDRLFYL